ncbi:Lrrc34 [Acrasis kona]|uniref:Lrrc34 n=1 Tax=Acrasis kona TaxID=1008807 RepID=A0AAW2Z8A2_9EUKA
MKSFLKNYEEKCDDYSVRPKKRLVSDLTELANLDEVTQHLILNGNCVAQFNDRIGDIELFPLCEVLEKDFQMTSLDLSYNNIGNHGAEAVSRMLKVNKALRHLSLRSNNITDQGAKSIANALTENRSLLSLDLSENAIEDKGGLVIAQSLQENTNLRVLNINSTELKTSSIVALAVVARNHPSLQVLRIAKPLLHSLREETTVHLNEMLRINKCLVTLDISNHGIRDEGITILTEALMHNSTLTKLVLASNSIAIDGGVALAKYLTTKKCTLKVLNLNSNRIDNVGGAELALALRTNKTLKSLNIMSNNIGDDSLFEIAKSLSHYNTSLKKIRILNNKFNQKCLSLLYDYIKSEGSIKIDITVDKVDDTFYVAQKRDCIKPDPTVNTTTTQIDKIEKLLGTSQQSSAMRVIRARQY